MKYPFGSEPNTSVVFPVLSFTFTNEVTLQVPTSCCLSGSAAPADNAAHVRAAAIGIDNSAFMVLPPVFRHVPSMTGSGLAAQPSQSLENIARGTLRSRQFIPQYRTDGQYRIDHSKTWACVRPRASCCSCLEEIGTNLALLERRQVDAIRPSRQFIECIIGHGCDASVL